MAHGRPHPRRDGHPVHRLAPSTVRPLRTTRWLVFALVRRGGGQFCCAGRVALPSNPMPLAGRIRGPCTAPFIFPGDHDATTYRNLEPPGFHPAEVGPALQG